MRSTAAIALVEAARQHGQPCLVSFRNMAAVMGWEPASLCAGPERARVRADWAVDEIDIDFATIRNLSPATFISQLRDQCLSRFCLRQRLSFWLSTRRRCQHLN